MRAAISKLAYYVGEIDSIANIFDRVTKSQCAAAYQYLGSAWMAEGVNNRAAWYLLEELRRSPVHKSTDIAVDKLEAQIKNSTDPKDLIVRYSIMEVLQPIHHCAADRNVHLSADEHHHIRRQFVDSNAEIKYKDRNWDVSIAHVDGGLS